MKATLIAAMSIATLLAGGCSGPLEDVTIVHIGEDEETGAPDQYTVIEFPDGSRKTRYGHYGELGDQFKARQSDWSK